MCSSDLGEPIREKWSFRRSNYFKFVGEECRNVMNNVGLQDMSAFAKMEVSGPKAREWLESILANKIPKKMGRVALCHLLTARGGVRAEFTVYERSPGQFYLVSAGALERMVQEARIAALRDRLLDAHHLQPVDLGHHDVEQDQVGQRLARHDERLLAVLGDNDLVAHALEAHAQDLDIVGDVVDDQDTGRVAHGLPEDLAHLGQHLARAVGLGDVVVAAGGARLLLVARQRVGGDGDHRDRAERRIGLDAPRRLVAVHHRHLDIHQDQVRFVFGRLRNTLRAVMRLDHVVTRHAEKVAEFGLDLRDGQAEDEVAGGAFFRHFHSVSGQAVEEKVRAVVSDLTNSLGVTNHVEDVAVRDLGAWVALGIACYLRFRPREPLRFAA